MLKPPSISQQSRELLIGRDAARLMLQTPTLRAHPNAEHPSTAILIPGLGGTDRILTPLRRFLNGLGHDVRKAELGRQSIDVIGTIPQLAERVRSVVGDVGHPISLIGWSVGGVKSREIARSFPDLIERVITFGTPVVGGPSYTAFSWLFSDRQRRRIEERIAMRSQIPISRPITAIWSSNDGVVAPAACIDRVNTDVDHVEVTSTHAGMCFDPDVWRAIARSLDTPAD